MPKKSHIHKPVDDLQSVSDHILEQKKLENSALRKILQYIERPKSVEGVGSEHNKRA